MPRMLTVLVCMLAVVALGGLSGCGSKVSKSKYDKIQEGMTLSQVQNILGPGELQSGGAISVPGFSGSGDVYVWKNKNGDKTITVTFANDKVIAKTASGL